jgi:heterodisulfide reductase subunit A-like polyferredoxin
LDKSPSIGGTMVQLDKTFPTNDCSMCILAPKLVGAGRHHNIELITNADVESIDGEVGNFKVTINKRARHIIEDKCTGCAECVEACPVSVPNEYNELLNDRKAIYLTFPQAVPRKVSISKRGTPPCRATCPAGINGQGYIALIRMGKWKEAFELIRQKTLMPGILGRICHHPCETECNRKYLDEPVAICQLKRFLADRAKEHDEEAPTPIETTKTEKIAVIGAGPGGLACGIKLMELGYPVTVFDSASEAGGMITSCLPEYRISKEVAKYEIDIILNRGLDVKYNTTVGKDISLKDIQNEYKSVYISIGSQNPAKLDVKGTDLNGVLLGLQFLREAKTGKKPEGFGSNVVVIGGGNVAIDCAKTAIRLGAHKVTITCLETRDLTKSDRMPAHDWEIEEVEEEGVEILDSLGPQEIVGKNGKAVKLITIKCLSVYDENRRFAPEFSSEAGSTLDADTIIVAIGQRTDLSGFEDIELTPWKTIKVDNNTLQTNIIGIFAGGDIVRGPASVIDAIADGNKAAEMIDRYQKGEQLIDEAELAEEKNVVSYDELDLPPSEMVKKPRTQPIELPAAERVKDFAEVISKTFTEEDAKREAERCLNCGLCSECFECVKSCLAEALDHDQTDEEVTIDVGSVILSPGFDEFDPKQKTEYGYGRIKNVISSIEFERILSATGPFEGHVKRVSDQKQPENIAFIQCVGSRDSSCGNEYCSSVCCMYSVKEAIIAQEHTPGLKTEIFFMDMRAFGKEFDDYYERAQHEYGIKFNRCRVANIEQSDNENVIINYVEDGKVKTKEFDMAVLAVGFESTKTAKKLAEQFGIELNKYNFAKTDPYSPLESTKPGIYISGAFNGPKDIPDTVAQASGAAAKASSVISEVRGTQVTEKEYPPEKDVTGEEPRIGVFVCHCGINIGGVVDVPGVTEYSKTLPNVTYAEHNLYTCSQDTQEKIKEMIEEHNLNRIIVASCTPRTHEPLFRSTVKEAGINPYLFVMTNIRDQCSWVHMHDSAEATEKAKDLIRMTVAKARLLEPLKNPAIDVTQEALVIGGGLAGMTAAAEIANNGFKVNLVEKEPELGGNLKDIYFELGTEKTPQDLLNDLKNKVEKDPLVDVHLNTTVNTIEGFIGNFETTLSNETQIKHGVVIVATGGTEYKPTEYLYGQHNDIITQKELEKNLANNDIPIGSMVMIQCIGSRTEERPNCSRICCTTAIKNALKVKELSPGIEIYILYKDIRTYGFREDYYREAAKAGVKFIRYDDENKPIVTDKDDLAVFIKDPVTTDLLKINPDIIVLSAGILPQDGNEQLAKLLKVPLSKDKFFLEAHMKLRPVDFATDGVFLCGLAHWPKFMDESISQANAAVARALTILANDKFEAEGVVARVNEDKCTGCETCITICPYGAPSKNPETGNVEINDVTCKGCGTCVASCPERAIVLPFFNDEQLLSQLKALIGGDERIAPSEEVVA